MATAVNVDDFVLAGPLNEIASTVGKRNLWFLMISGHKNDTFVLIDLDLDGHVIVPSPSDLNKSL